MPIRRCVSAAALALLAGSVRAQSFSESFSDLSTLPGSGWVIINHSQPLGTNAWFQGNPSVFGAQSTPGYIAANVNSTVPDGGTISDWLLTPPRTLTNGDTLQFYTRTITGSLSPDRLQVRLSTNGASTNIGTSATDVGDFTVLLLDLNPNYTTTGYPGAWQQFTVAVSGLPGPTAGRFALRYFVEQGGAAGPRSNYIGIDDAVYTVGGVVTGACCLIDGNCTLSTGPSCAAAQGTYRGDHTQCATANCPQPGACCRTDGSCISTLAASCATQNGVFRGEGALCSTANCPQPPTGACCFANGSCQILTSAICATQSGAYQGDGVTCAAANCGATIYVEQGDAGETLATAAQLTGHGGLLQIQGNLSTTSDTDLYQFRICDAANFHATTVGGATFDTNLSLFRADGRGVTFDEDAAGSVLQSTLTAQFVAPLGPGVYYLAVGAFPRDALSAGGLIWNATPFSLERAPDGPGAAGVLTGWNGAAHSNGTYTVSLTGACFLSSTCYANCDGSTTAPVLNIADFVCFMGQFAAGDSRANCDGSTSPPILTVSDFVCFQNQFSQGCP